MKKTFLLSLALGLSGATMVQAQDVFITGSTAFRANCYNACTKLFSGTPTIQYGDGAHGNAGNTASAKALSWVMTGTPIASLQSAFGSLIIHGLFTGSLQGSEAVETAQQLTWAVPDANGTYSGTYINKSATMAFSDCDPGAAPYPVPSGFSQAAAAVQPFVIMKSCSTNPVMASISNVSWEQLKFGIDNGRIPLAAWTGKGTDTNTFIYLYQRTKDSGTRRIETAGADDQYNTPVTTYLWDATNNVFYTPSGAASNQTYGNGVANVLGSEGPGNGNANYNWGYGYIGGGDIANNLLLQNSNNTAIAFLSISDAKSVHVGSGNNWQTAVSYNGFWPIAAGSGLQNNIGTNDFSPICLGYYSLWGQEVIVYRNNPAGAGDQTINQAQQTAFLGVFNAQTTGSGTSPVAGSIENEIIISQPPAAGPATAIPIQAMWNQRPSVGGEIYPNYPD